MPVAPPSITIQPPASRWADRLAHGVVLDSERARFRTQLGLPINRPVVLSGHQAAIWHPGILAKWLAITALARRYGAAPAWLVVDQDANPFATIRVPVRHAQSPMGLRTEEHLLVAGVARDRVGAEVPLALIPAFDPAPPSAELLAAAALPTICDGLERLVAALRTHCGARSAAEQLARATTDLIAPIDSGPPVPLLFASALAQTDLFQHWVARMQDDPAACAEAYNAAVAAFPHAGIAPLAATQGTRCELPLWRLDPSAGVRTRVYASALPSIPVEQLAPRALLQTAILRAAGCEVFVHGLGGGGDDGASGYDALTDLWIARWLGASLAPVATVSATLRLPLADRLPTDPAELARAIWTRHHARHSPAMLAETGTESMKRVLGRMAARTDRSHSERAALFRRVGDLLAELRQANAPRLRRLDRAANDLRARLADEAILSDRTWAFPLHDPAALGSLRAAIEASLG